MFRGVGIRSFISELLALCVGLCEDGFSII